MRNLIFLGLFLTKTALAQPPIVNGWTQFAPSADSRIIYVSAMSGNDATGQFYAPNDPQIGGDVYMPTGTILAFSTISAAKAQLRSGFPDYLLFKSGETWANQNFGTMNISGRNINEPLVIGNYGPGVRPQILTGDLNGIELIGGNNSHFALTGLYFKPHTLGSGDSPSAFLTFSEFSNIWIENCAIDAFPGCIIAHSPNSDPTGEVRTKLDVRRTIVTDGAAYGTLPSQPIFLNNINGILFDECVLDHNGWNVAIGSFPTAFKHNTYFQVKNSNVVFKKNIVARASATGIGMRCGGTVDDNLVLENVNNIQFGTSESTINWPTESVTGSLTNNVVIGARNESFDPGRAIFIAKAANVLVQNNIIKDYANTVLYTNAMTATDGYANLNIQANKIYNWCQNIPFGPGTFYGNNNGIQMGIGAIGTSSINNNHVQQLNPGGGCAAASSYPNCVFSNNKYFSQTVNNSFQSGSISYATWLAQSGETGSMFTQVSYPEPGRNISTYMASLGLSGGLPEFMAGARLLSKGNWDTDYTATVVTDYIRAGFAASLPVELIDFKAAIKGSDAVLAWATAATFNTRMVEIQHSLDGIFFEKIGEKPVQTGQNHSFAHRQPGTGRHFYRLNFVDFDGLAELSPVVAVEFLSPDWTVFPNPTDGVFQVQSAENLAHFNYRIKSSDGRTVKIGAVQSGRIDLGDQPAGLYFVEIFDEKGLEVVRFLKK